MTKAYKPDEGEVPFTVNEMYHDHKYEIAVEWTRTETGYSVTVLRCICGAETNRV